MSRVNKVKSFFTEEPEDNPLPDTVAKVVENPSVLLPQLDALRKHLLRSVLALMVTVSISFLFTRRIMDLLAVPIGGMENVQAIEVTEPVGVFMRVALLSGFALALPYIAFELWLFLAEGLRPRARLIGLIAIPAVVIFFVGGMAFAYFFIIPNAVPFLLHFMGIPTLVRPSSYISFVTGLMFWVGAAFEFPLIIFVLAGIGIVKARPLANQWRLAIVIIAVLSALITPTVDPVNMSLVMGPMIVLYFISIGLAYLAERARR